MQPTLHVTLAAINQQIKQLEDYLGTQLFFRAEALALTEAASKALPLLLRVELEFA